MKVYIQDADGNEVELVVREPDPKDGTFCAFLPVWVYPSYVLKADGETWIRIVPNE